MSPDSPFLKSLTPMNAHPIFAAVPSGQLRTHRNLIGESGKGSDSSENREPAWCSTNGSTGGLVEVGQVIQIGLSSPLALLDSNEEKLIKTLMDIRPRVLPCNR